MSIHVKAPTTRWPINVDNVFKRSWGEDDAHLNEEHARIFGETKSLPGWQEVGDSEKLYEMAYHNGAVILEIGTYAGRSAAVQLRGAVSGLAMSAHGRLPQFYGLDHDLAAIERTHKTLQALELLPHALLFLGGLSAFRRQIPIVPTMVFVDGSHQYAELWADMHSLSEMLAPGTPVLCHDYSGIPAVTRALDEWMRSGYFEPMGRFGCSVLLVATKLCRGKPRGLPLEVFDNVRQGLLKEYLHSDGTAAWNHDAKRIKHVTEPARTACLADEKLSPDYGKHGWPYENPEKVEFPDSLPDGMPWPKISVVTPSYNYGRFLEETILSIRNQGYPNVEHILIDGGSTDNTAEVIAKYRDTFAFAVSEPDKGQSSAINKGFARATGDLFTWINADDMLAPGALHGMAMAFWHSKADVVAGICEQYRDGRLLEKHMTCCENGPLPLEELLDVEGSWVKGQFFMQPEVMFTRAIWEKAGGTVDEGLFYSMDYELWLRFAAAGARLHVIGRPICHFRHHEEQKTALPEKFIPELLRVRDAFAAEHKVVPAKNPIPESPRYRLRIASVTDVGFRYGAGIGQKRIMTALTGSGHDVYSFAAMDDGASREVAGIEEIVAAVGAVSPDVVLIGNVHASRLPPELLSACAKRWPTGLIMHDLWALTGRCAYTGDCTKYLTGCDETCPTADQYPPLPREEIRPQWEAKYELYKAAHAPLLLANSDWSAALARQSLAARGPLPERSPVFTIRYGVELDLFRPLPKHFCRQELDLPQSRFLILASASSLNDERKGIKLLAEAVRQLSVPDVTVVCLGHPDDALQAALPGIRALGYISDPRRLAMVYSAVDLFVGASQEEAFGQVFTEASACGTPSVGFPVGGIPEAIADGVTGYVAGTRTAKDLASAIYELYSHPERRRAMAVWGRIFTENEWSPQMAYHGLHVALRKSGIFSRLHFPPKIRFAPYASTVPTPVNLALQRGTWQPISGFEAWEGPYPDQGLPRCRWLVGPASRFRVMGSRPGAYRVRISCTTFHPNATLRVMYKDQVIHDIAVPYFVRGQPVCDFECVVNLDGTAGSIELLHWPWAINDSARAMSILLFDLQILDPVRDDVPLVEPAMPADQPAHRK